jgi:hypothetical protein
MLEYAKTILKKVSFDRRLFEKELIKALNLIVPNDLKEFKNWCYDQFGHMYDFILNKHLSHI